MKSFAICCARVSPHFPKSFQTCVPVSSLSSMMVKRDSLVKVRHRGGGLTSRPAAVPFPLIPRPLVYAANVSYNLKLQLQRHGLNQNQSLVCNVSDSCFSGRRLKVNAQGKKSDPFFLLIPECIFN